MHGYRIEIHTGLYIIDIFALIMKCSSLHSDAIRNIASQLVLWRILEFHPTSHFLSNMLTIHDTVASVNSSDNATFTRLEEEWDAESAHAIDVADTASVTPNAVHCCHEATAADSRKEVSNINHYGIWYVRSGHPLVTSIENLKAASGILMKKR